MKTLQNDFTTPKQSKRLLELGVPADSADLCYRFYTDLSGDTTMYDVPSVIAENQHIEWLHKLTSGDTAYIPCWSVGRLMEIYDICRCYDGDWDEVYGKETYIETYVSAIKEAVLDDMLDFSKLED